MAFGFRPPEETRQASVASASRQSVRRSQSAVSLSAGKNASSDSSETVTSVAVPNVVTVEMNASGGPCSPAARRSATIFTSFRDEPRLDAIEKIIPLAAEAGLPMTHLAMAFAIAHPGVTSAIIGPRTMEQLDDLLAGAEVTLGDAILDRIDEIVPPGTDVGVLDMAYVPPAISNVDLRRRPAGERAASRLAR